MFETQTVCHAIILFISNFNIIINTAPNEMKLYYLWFFRVIWSGKVNSCILNVGIENSV